MTDDQLELRLRDWYRTEIPSDETAPTALRARLVTIPRVSALPGRGFRSRRGVALLAAAALLTAAIAGGALLVGSGIVKLPSVPPSIGPSTAPTVVDPSATLPSDLPTAPPAESGLIAYVKFVPLEAVGGVCARGANAPSLPLTRAHAGCSRIWVSSTDGTGAHELLPDHPGYQTPLQWSADGTRLLVEDAAGLWLVDTTGTIVQSLPLEGLCPGDCPPIWGYALAPDGATIAFARPPITTSGNSVIALADVATGHVTELASTASFAPTTSYGKDAPRWSPDGTRLIFTREEGGSQPGGALFMVDVDGTDLHQFLPMELYAILPRWSPDGSLVAFQSLAPGKEGVYVVRPDGTGLRQVTSRGASAAWPEWTADGRLVSTHMLGNAGFELWIMDADGANTAMLPVDDVTRLTAANCLVCAWDPDGDFPRPEFPENALWQPRR
jgi:dipeptidyl aminopeptidase/acylaminoacyl peptidase